MDVCFIRRVENDDRLMCQCVIHPLLQLLLRSCCAGRVVRVAQVDHVRCLLGQCGHEVIFRYTRHVGHVAPTLALLDVVSAASGHGVGVHIYRIYGVADCDAVVLGEDIADVSAVTLCSVADEDLVQRDLHAACLIILIRDLAAQELVAEVRSVAAEGSRLAHLINRRMHRLDDCGCQRLGDVTDTEADHVLIGMRCLILTRLAAYGRKQVAARKFQVILIYLKHSSTSVLKNTHPFYYKSAENARNSLRFFFRKEFPSILLSDLRRADDELHIAIHTVRDTGEVVVFICDPDEFLNAV